ncbi:unnamed protein product [Adineta steineri]|uniref:Peptidase S1 domain-containing protein n=1 Tax=Adineta steineri TaxID=433720 RepID=A0A813PD69_9BILA|nr:unnamed protein product [Adineta steineri]CAF3487467.1 unnamed protein product [Adineta steineri]
MKFLLLLSLGILIDGKYFECNKKKSCGCGYSNVEINARIINGEEAIPFSWSMAVSIRYDLLHNGNALMHVCGGTILTNSYILTAANCVEEIKGDVKLANLTIAAGIHRRSQSTQIIRQVDDIIVHPNWTSSWNQNQNDIALLHLSEPLDLENNTFITRTCLPSQINISEELIQYPPTGAELAVLGWGRSSPYGDDSDILQQLIVSTIDTNHTKCKDIITDPDRQFCAGIRDVSTGSCYGDFGGPILQWIGDHWQQVGIASFTPDGCAQNSAIGYTRLAYYRSWIDEHLSYDAESTEEISMTTTSTHITISDIATNLYQCDKYKVPCGCGRRSVQFSQLNISHNNYEAIPYSWSMIVSIRSNDKNKHLCSGTILSESYILTSGSCIANLSAYGIIILAGIHNQSEDNAIYRKVDQIYLHSNYTGILNNYAYDIAILHMSQPLDIDHNLFISRTCLVEKEGFLSHPFFYPTSGTKLAVIGWGLLNCHDNTNHDLLQQIEIYPRIGLEDNCYILDKYKDVQFCAGSLDNPNIVPCVGDPGSPIFQWSNDRWQQVGIASYVIDRVQFKSIGIYTRTIEFNNWIQSIIDNCSTASSTQTPTTPLVDNITTNIKPQILYECNTTSTCGCGRIPVALTPSRIVGGEDARELSWPMVVSLRWSDPNRHWCGGSILSDSYILTAAHCLHGYASNPPVDVTIVAGMTNLSDPKQIRRTIDHIYIHSEYIGVQNSFRHDIAVLHLNQSLTTENNPYLTKTCIHPVILPTVNNQYIKNGTRLAVIGWGTMGSGVSLDPKILQQAEVFAIDNNDPICTQTMNDSEIQFCAGLREGGKDSCSGDSGGPIFQWTGEYWEQVGIVSYGNGCAEPNDPGVYVRLSYYYNWINDILKNDNEHTEPKRLPDTTTTPTTDETLQTTTSGSYNHLKNTLTFTIIIYLFSIIL